MCGFGLYLIAAVGAIALVFGLSYLVASLVTACSYANEYARMKDSYEERLSYLEGKVLALWLSSYNQPAKAPRGKKK